MYSIYRLNADDLSIEFLESLKTLFRHKAIEIAVCEAEGVEGVRQQRSAINDQPTITDLLAKPESADIDFDPPHLPGRLAEPADLT